MTIRSYLEKFATETPQAEAMEYFGPDKEWHTRTWAEFLEGVTRTADAYGPRFALVPQQENVAIILPNSPTWTEAYLAQAGAGVAVVPIDPKLRNHEVEFILKDSGTVVVTTDQAHLGMMQAIAPNLPALRAVVIVDGEGTSYEPIGSVAVCDYAALKTEAQAGWYASHVATLDDVASVIYTSGTTGQPKGAMLTHGNFVADIQGAFAEFEWLGIGAGDSLFVVLPLFHAFSFSANFVAPFMKGSSMSFCQSLRTVGQDIHDLKPTVLCAVPLLAEKLHDRIESGLAKSKVARLLMKIGLRGPVMHMVKLKLGGRLRFFLSFILGTA